MAYRLKEKENAFRVTREGPFESHRFEHGVLYDKVPEEEKNRFEEAESPSDEGAQKKSKGVK